MSDYAKYLFSNDQQTQVKKEGSGKSKEKKYFSDELGPWDTENPNKQINILLLSDSN